MIITDTDKIAAAKLWLVSAGRTVDPSSPRDQPYLAHALYSLTTVPCTDVATMTCDEHWRVYANPSWVTSASVRDVGSMLVHLTWHLLLDHAQRGRSLAVDAVNAAAWHSACDCAVEPSLTEARLTPDGFPSAASLGIRDGLSAEEYFATLSRLPVTTASSSAPDEDGCGSGCDGLMHPYELPPGVDLGEVGPEDARQLRRLVSIAYREHITSRGLTPGDVWRWTVEVLEPAIRWESLLALMVRRAIAWTNGHSDYTYRRRSRRQGAVPNVVLPGTRRPVPNVALVIDTSGSVDDGLLGRALAEVTEPSTGSG